MYYTFEAQDCLASLGGSEALCLLKKGKVISVPGTAFGSMGEGYLRLCFANSDEAILEGVRRIKAFVTKEFPVK